MKKYIVELSWRSSHKSLYDAFESINGKEAFSDYVHDPEEYVVCDTEEEGRKALEGLHTKITLEEKEWIRRDYSLNAYELDEDGELGTNPEWIADSTFGPEDYKEFASVGAASISGGYIESDEDILRAVQTAFDAADVDIDLTNPGEQDIHRFLLADKLDIITINEGSDGQCYAWYKDDNKEGFASVDTGEEISEERAEELGLF